MGTDLYDFEGTIVHETELAVLIDVGGTEHWFPLSIIENHLDGTFTIPAEWAEEKGLG